MKFALHLPNFGPFGDPRALVRVATTAEQAGWDGLFLWDHIRWEHDRWPVTDPWIALAAIAALTSRLALGPMVTPLPRRRPSKLAREAVALDQLSNGRLIFGAGLGWGQETEFAALGEDGDERIRAAKLDEALDVLEGLWTGEPFSFAGEHYTVTGATFEPPPVQRPRIPIWIAGLWPNKRPFRRAARWDGAFPERRDGGTLTPGEVADVARFMDQSAPSTHAREIAIAGYADDHRRSFAEYERSGLTWWLERIDPGRGLDLERTLALAAAGPPGRRS